MEKPWYEKLLEEIFGMFDTKPKEPKSIIDLVNSNLTVSSIPKFGDKGVDVRTVQRMLNKSGVTQLMSVDGDFGRVTKRAVSVFQKSKNLNGSGVIGPKTLRLLDITVVALKPIKGKPKAPWFWKLKKYEGQSEHNADFNKDMSSYWGKVGLPGFKSIVGSARAWCGLFVAAGLIQAGVSYQKTGARAKDWDKYGTAVEWKLDGFYQGDIVRINSKGDCKSSKGNHVTMANGDCTGRDLMKPAAVFSGYGGNQGNKAKVSNYAVNRICSVRRPSEAFVRSKVTVSINCSNGKTADNESTR